MKMAALPSPTQVAGSHNSIYESYYLLVDPSNQGSVGAVDAAKFLKKSGLPDVVLSKIWDLSDPNGKGYLNKPGFFVALKLVSLAQNGREVNVANILSDVPPPKMADVPAVIQNNVINSVQATLSDWAIKPNERAKYDQLFDSLQPLNGVIPGNKVKGLLMDSKLPVDTLGKIWDLADMDKDGSLDRHEFVVAMHLVYKALEKYAIPNSVPPELLPPGKRKDPLPSAAPIIPIAPITKPEPAKPPPVPQTPWVVTAEERAKYDVMFLQSDVDKDGFVSGHEIKNVFLQSGVPQQVLAHIWGLCDMKQTGKLNVEQFALAMWLINQKLKGKDPPPALTPEMIPPSARGKPTELIPIQNETEPQVNEIVRPFKRKMEDEESLPVELLKVIVQKEIKSDISPPPTRRMIAMKRKFDGSPVKRKRWVEENLHVRLLKGILRKKSKLDTKPPSTTGSGGLITVACEGNALAVQHLDKPLRSKSVKKKVCFIVPNECKMNDKESTKSDSEEDVSNEKLNRQNSQEGRLNEGQKEDKMELSETIIEVIEKMKKCSIN